MIGGSQRECFPRPSFFPGVPPNFNDLLPTWNGSSKELAPCAENRHLHSVLDQGANRVEFRPFHSCCSKLGREVFFGGGALPSTKVVLRRCVACSGEGKGGFRLVCVFVFVCVRLI